MNAAIVESVQHGVTPGVLANTYYQGEENTQVQAFASTVENRFNLSLPSLNFGSSSTLLFNPTEGVGDIVLTATLPARTGSRYANWAAPKSWLAAAVDNIALRIGGSSLYYFGGDQIFIDTLSDCEDSGKKDAVAVLAGAELKQLTDFDNENNRTASIYIKLPFNSISSLQKPLPLPTDCLTQPIQILITFKPATKFFFETQSAALESDLPDKFEAAQVNFKQVHLADHSKLLAERKDLNREAYSYGLQYFTNLAFRTVQGTNGSGQTQYDITLSGFRSGSIKWIDIWAVAADDVDAGQPLKFTDILDARLSVNGLIYYDTQNASSQMWGLCNTKTSTSWNTSFLKQTSPTPDGNAVAEPYAAKWIRVPFAQTSEVLANEYELVTGLPIMNSVVNLSITMPDDRRYYIAASSHYVSSLLFSKGSCEYVF